MLPVEYLRLFGEWGEFLIIFWTFVVLYLIYKKDISRLIERIEKISFGSGSIQFRELKEIRSLIYKYGGDEAIKAEKELEANMTKEEYDNSKEKFEKWYYETFPKKAEIENKLRKHLVLKDYPISELSKLADIMNPARPVDWRIGQSSTDVLNLPNEVENFERACKELNLIPNVEVDKINMGCVESITRGRVFMILMEYCDKKQ